MLKHKIQLFYLRIARCCGEMLTNETDCSRPVSFVKGARYTRFFLAHCFFNNSMWSCTGCMNTNKLNSPYVLSKFLK